MRASRLLAILILLQNRGRMTAAALADEFEVTERTIYRDIDALSMAGVPVFGDRGPGGGFALLDGYRTRLTGLANDEAAALAFAGVPGAAAAAGFGAALRGAFGKLFAALPGEGGTKAEAAAGRFHVDPADWYRGADPSPLLPDLARAVLASNRIELQYQSWTKSRAWTLDPLGLVLKAGEWYLVGRGGSRIGTFRVAMIERLVVREFGFERPAGFDLARWWSEAEARFEGSLFTATARLRASALGCERLARLGARGRIAVAAASPDTAGWSLLEMPVEDSDHGARELLAMGPEIEVLAPETLRLRVAELAEAILARNGGAGGYVIPRPGRDATPAAPRSRAGARFPR